MQIDVKDIIVCLLVVWECILIYTINNWYNVHSPNSDPAKQKENSQPCDARVKKLVYIYLSNPIKPIKILISSLTKIQKSGAIYSEPQSGEISRNTNWPTSMDILFKF
jgi:hypothetical protein